VVKLQPGIHLSRRTAAIGCLAAAVNAQAASTVILVPGAWHGAWCFAALVESLEKTGVTAKALTLPGVAERAAEATAQLGLQAHIDAVTHALPPGRSVLVGHSYAGLVVTAAAAQKPEAVRSLIYLDAFVPKPGDSLLSMMKSPFAASWRAKAAAGDGWRVPPMLSARAMGVPARMAESVDRRLTPQPLRTFEEPVMFDPKRLETVERCYVRCNRYAGFARFEAMAIKQGWRVARVDAGHDAMLAAPVALAQTLLQLM
jgi:pimeloyl-ACP methyl ester carboxylesterase